MQWPRWRSYQVEVAEFFCSLGLTAQTDVSVRGARTSHDIDVVVRSSHGGVELCWLVECRYWKKRIPKSAVFALRQIVTDVGADRGFIFNEKGYQSGAREAAEHSNITLTSLAEFGDVAADDVCDHRLQCSIPRIDSCRQRYWALDKWKRIETGLRHDVGTVGYSAVVVMNAAELVVRQAQLGLMPIEYDRVTLAVLSYNGVGHGHFVPETSSEAISKPDICERLEEEICDVERRLATAETARVDGEPPSE